MKEIQTICIRFSLCKRSILVVQQTKAYGELTNGMIHLIAFFTSLILWFLNRATIIFSFSCKLYIINLLEEMQIACPSETFWCGLKADEWYPPNSIGVSFILWTFQFQLLCAITLPVVKTAYLSVARKDYYLISQLPGLLNHWVMFELMSCSSIFDLF